MAKRFKLKISRVLQLSLQSCRSKDHTTLPVNPVPSFLRLSPANPKLITLDFPPTKGTPSPPLPTSKPHRSLLKRHVSSAFTSLGCGLGSRSSMQYFSECELSESQPPPTPQFHWEREDRWHVIARVYDEKHTSGCNSLVLGDSSEDDFLPPPPPPPSSAEKKKRRSKKKKTEAKIRISTSSTDSGLFSSESFEDNDDIDEEEMETLVSSSRSFSTDSSSELNCHLETIREASTMKRKKKNNKKVKGQKRCVLKEKSGGKRSCSSAYSSSPEIESPARLSSFLQRLIPCTVDGKVRESFAVVKRSKDPYEDFKRSMMEMILEKQMFEQKDLEQLLHCFLSLNSRQHHGIIVKAFSEIWENLFCGRRSSSAHRVSKDL